MMTRSAAGGRLAEGDAAGVPGAGWLLRKVGPKRAQAMDPSAEGGDRGYSVSGLLSKAKAPAHKQ